MTASFQNPGPGTMPLIPAAPVDPVIQAALDENHLKLLEIGFYISGALTAIRFILFLLIAVSFCIAGLAASLAAHHISNGTSGKPPPAFVFFICASVFGAIILLTLVFAGFEIYAGRCLKKREHPLLIQIVAAIYCLSIPWGTAMGVFTFMVMNRPSVKSLFGHASQSLQTPTK